MKFSLSWLRAHLETQAPLERIVDVLSSIGLEVEGVEDRAAALAPFLTARVTEAVQHPNADRLRVCRVDTGSGEVSVVCGAPNARTGMHAVFAPPGAFIPGSGITLKVGEIRGVQSAGMLVSAREMGLGEDHDGIVELPEGSPVGVPYASFAGLDDPVIEIGVTPNRGDALSVRGVARDLAAAGVGVLKPWRADPLGGGFASAVAWHVDGDADCPWIVGRTIRGVRNGPSPEWLQRRLMSIGLRPISALVDVTNFFAFDLGRPLHVFDADRIAGGILTVRRGAAGESFRALNGRDLEVSADDLVIADDLGVVSLAGVMGGERTGSSEATTSVFVECALFDPVRVALSGRRHGLASDARQRFERGIDPSLLPEALDAACRMIMDLCGGEASAVAEAGAEPAWRRQASLRFARLAELGGAEVAPGEACTILETLGFGVAARDAERLTVDVPPWRNDVAGMGALDQLGSMDAARAEAAAAGAAAMEPECDLIEEVLRIYGLDRIAAVSLPREGAVPGPALSAAQVRGALARRVLASRGLAECVTTSFTGREVASWFGPAPAGLRLNNPIAADLDQMRPTPLAMLAQAARRNADRGAEEIALFEVGPGYDDGRDGTTVQNLIAAGLRAGEAPRHWMGTAPRNDALQAKADALAVLAALGVPAEALSITPDAPAHYHPGRSGSVRQGPKVVLAHFGALHPALLQRLGLSGEASATEIFLDRIAEPKRRKRAVPELPDLQPVHRGFAFAVRTDIPAEQVLRAARGAERSLISRVGLFDVFEGGTLQAGYRSLGIEVVFQPRERTLTDNDIEAASAKVVDAVVKATGAQLR